MTITAEARRWKRQVRRSNLNEIYENDRVNFFC